MPDVGSAWRHSTLLLTLSFSSGRGRTPKSSHRVFLTFIFNCLSSVLLFWMQLRYIYCVSCQWLRIAGFHHQAILQIEHQPTNLFWFMVLPSLKLNEET
jgi:hypothetical protein